MPRNGGNLCVCASSQGEVMGRSVTPTVHHVCFAAYGFADALTLDERDRQALFAAEMEIENIGWRSWKRYSTRQRTKQDMSGLVGRLWLASADRRARRLIWLAQQVHIGKNVTLGLGAYEATHSHRL